MSREEHDETVVAISTGVAYIIKMGKIIVPVLSVLVCTVIWIGYKAISINEWNNSLIKRPEFNKEIATRAKGDSTLNAKIDTISKSITYGNYTQHKDKYGNITYKNVN